MKPPRRPHYPQDDDVQAYAQGEGDPDFPEQESNHGRRYRGRGNRVIPLLIVAGFGLFILKEEVPAVNDAFLSVIKPNAMKAIKACRAAALASSPNPDFARMLKYGRANKTGNGYFVDALMIGELEQGQGEVRRSIECHVDAAGNVVDIARHTATAAALPPQFTQDSDAANE